MALTAPINDLLEELFPFRLDALAVTWGESAFTLTGAGDVLDVPCRLSMKNQKVLSSTGGETVSAYKVICNGAFGLDVENFVYNLPTSVPGPHTELQAVAIKSPQDENGIHHQTLFFRGR